jgi:sialate O-acetylesterase
MLKTLNIPGTGMAIAIDIGEKDNIHPKNKQDVGRRLALWALAEVYGKQAPAISGPLPTGQEIRDGEIIIRFNHTARGLKARHGGGLKGFVIAGTDQRWRAADARIDGQTVIVSSPYVPQPAAVRYAWENFPDCNLVNSAGLPASPFRTDDWSETQP